MKNIDRWSIVLLAFCLVACGQQDAPPPETAEAGTEQPAEPVRSAPADSPLDGSTAAESTEAEQANIAGIETARNERNRLREQYQALRDSWDVEAIAVQFALSDSQKIQLQNARETLVAERVAVRNRLRSIRDLQQQAQQAGNETETEALANEASQVQERLAVAERDWKTTLSRILTMEQLSQISGAQ